MKIKGKKIAITGAGNGLGRALAIALSEQGAILFLCDINEQGLSETADMIDGEVYIQTVDVASFASIEQWYRSIQEQSDYIDILINNAGITVLSSFEEHCLEDWERVMSVNVLGVVYCTRIFLPLLRKSTQPWIANVSSIFGVIAMPSQAAYCTSKYAIRGFSEVLWEELKDVGVSVVHPGGIATSIVDSAPTSSNRYKERLSNFFAKGALPPDRAAQQLIEGLQKEQKRIFIGKEARLFDRMKRLFPIWGNGWCYRQIKTAMGIADVESEIISQG